MTDFSLTVINAIADEKYSKCFTEDIFNEGIKGELAVYDGGEIAAPKGGALLFVTDNADAAHKAAEKRTKEAA